MTSKDSGNVYNLNMIFIAIVTIVVLLASWQIRGILMLAFAGVMLTMLASMPVRFFMRWGLNRVISILLSISSGFLLILLFGSLVLPTLFDQFDVLFTSTIPNGINRLVDLWNSGRLYDELPYLEDLLARIELSAIEIDAELLNQALNQGSNAVSRLGGSLLPILGGFATFFLSTLIIFFICFFLIAEPERYIQGIVLLTPLWYRNRMRDILARIDRTVRAWLRVTGVSMLIVGAATGLGLAVVGIEQWLALGVLAGVLYFVPNFGTLIALVPSVAVAIIQVPESLITVILVIVIVSFIQAQIIGPIITSESMQLPPVLILIGQVVFGFFFGFLGLMLAVPLTAITVVMVDEIYIRDVLGDTSGKHKDESQENDELARVEAD